MITKPLSLDKIGYLAKYVSKVTDNNLIEALENQNISFVNFLNTIPNNKHLFAYTDGKWTIKHLLCHIIDTERIFSYRALRMARLDNTPLPGFDENAYAENSQANHIDFADLVKEFSEVRLSILSLYKNMSANSLDFTIEANGLEVSARVYGYVIVGHLNHHLQIIKERYL